MTNFKDHNVLAFSPFRYLGFGVLFWPTLRLKPFEVLNCVNVPLKGISLSFTKLLLRIKGSGLLWNRPNRLISCKMKNQFYSSKLIEGSNGAVETLRVEPPTILVHLDTWFNTKVWQSSKYVFHNELQPKPLNMITENFIVWLMRLNLLSPKSLIVIYLVV